MLSLAAPGCNDVSDGRSGGIAAQRAQLSYALAAEEQKVTAHDAAERDLFGTSVAVDGDTAVVGAPWVDLTTADEGAAYVFVRGTDGTWTEAARLTASTPAMDGYFGHAVDISGAVIAVGAYGVNSDRGRVYMFRGSGASWTQEVALQASDQGSGDYFGCAVAVDGTRLVVGAYGNDDAGSNSGSTYVFEYASASWSQVAKLVASDGAAGDNFGAAVAIDGDSVLVGSAGDDSISGAAYVYARQGDGAWPQQAKLTSSVRHSNAYFAHDVTIDGDTAVAGAFGEPNGGTRRGLAFVFVRDGGGAWTQQTALEPSIQRDNDNFGRGVALEGDRVAVGKRYEYIPALLTEPGSTYLFDRSGTTWSEVGMFYPADGQYSDFFGWVLDLSGTTLVVGTANDDDGGLSAGAAYFEEFARVGEACVAGATCNRGYCVDSVCCDGACGGGSTADCQACSIAAGAARDGFCGALAAGAAAAVVCRPAAGNCDIAETCLSRSVRCPADVVRSAGTLCRAASGGCDVTETCLGDSGQCPPDRVSSLGTQCRASAGTCDAAEYCSGRTGACPGDRYSARGTVCRSRADLCDAPEFCAGNAPTCPSDEVEPAGVICRRAASTCDLGETCDGSSIACTTDLVATDGTSCDDLSACNGTASCVSGVCIATAAIDCGDGNDCTADSCVEPGNCRHAEIAGCGVDAGADAGADTGADAGADVGADDAGDGAAADASGDAGPPDATVGDAGGDDAALDASGEGGEIDAAVDAELDDGGGADEDAGGSAGSSTESDSGTGGSDAGAEGCGCALVGRGTRRGAGILAAAIALLALALARRV